MLTILQHILTSYLCYAVELQAVGHANSPIIVDITPPLVGKVYDGPLTRHDLSYSKDSNMVKLFLV